MSNNIKDQKPIVYTDAEGKPDGEGSICYITFETFKENLHKDLSKSVGNRKRIIQSYRRDYITKALLINKVRNEYTRRKHKKVSIIPEAVREAVMPIGERFDLKDFKQAIDDLIKFENYLNEIEPNLKPKKEAVTVDLKSFFNDVDEDTIKRIQEKFKGYTGKRLAMLLHRLVDLNLVAYLPNSKTKSRKHFVELFKNESYNLSYINRILSDENELTSHTTNDPDYMDIKEKLSKALKK